MQICTFGATRAHNALARSALLILTTMGCGGQTDPNNTPQADAGAGAGGAPQVASGCGDRGGGDSGLQLTVDRGGQPKTIDICFKGMRITQAQRGSASNAIDADGQ